MKYTIVLERSTTERATVKVEAENADEAETIAQDMEFPIKDANLIHRETYVKSID